MAAISSSSRSALGYAGGSGVWSSEATGRGWGWSCGADSGGAVKCGTLFSLGSNIQLIFS